MSYYFRDADEDVGSVEEFGVDLPSPKFPTLPPEDELEKVYKDKIHTDANGVVKAIISAGAKRRWNLEFPYITTEEAQALQAWADKRQFQFDPGTSTYVNVRAVGDFLPVHLRGPYRKVKLVLEEV